MRYSKSVGIIALAALVGCATGSQKEVPPLYTPQFDYQPSPESQSQGEAPDVSFALVSPSFGSEEMSNYGGPFEDFTRELEADFQEMLNERGYTVGGPYDSYSVMTYPQRERTDLTLVPTINIDVATMNVASEYEPAPLLSLKTEGNYTLSGTEELSGNVTLALRETLTGERMWFKKIELPTKRVSWDSYTGLSEARARRVTRLGDRIGAFYSRSDDPGYLNPVSKALEAYYQRAMEVSWDYLNPSEMAHLKGLADELKASYSPGL